eukprot:9332004-Ditylum_brightwellii.AAC.1
MSTKQQEPVIGRKSVRCAQGMMQKLQAREFVVMMWQHEKIANDVKCMQSQEKRTANGMKCMQQHKKTRESMRNMCWQESVRSRNSQRKKAEPRVK